MTQRTGGFPSPYRSEASNTFRTAVDGRSAGAGVNPRSCISLNATTNMTSSTATRRRNGTPSDVAWAITPPATEPPSIAAPDTICPRPRILSEPAVVVGVVQRVDEPRLDRAREEGEPEPEQDRDDRP